MTGDRERLARVALGRLGEPGDPRLARLVADLGADEVFRGLLAEQDLDGLGGDLVARLHGLDPAAELADGRARGLRFVCPGDAEWPAGLADLDRAEPLQGRGGAPLGLWLRGPGRLDELAARAVAVVGSRSATSYGTAVAGDLSAHLAGAGTTVVSGAAYGIDQAAHRGVLAARGPTVAVLACGADRCYPAGHQRLVDYIAETGLVVSEAPPGCAPTRVRFLSRNRLIATLTDGTVVVEAAVRSGALNTASWALRLHRVVMGVPGPVTSAPSEGVHELIRTRGAALVTRGEDVLELVAPAGGALVGERRAPVRARDRLGGVEQRVLDAVPVTTGATVDALSRVAGVASTQVPTVLETLREAGLVALGQGPDGPRWRLASPPRDVEPAPTPSGPGPREPR